MGRAHDSAVHDDVNFAGEKDKREEQVRRVDIVVQGDFPGVVVDKGKLLLNEDGVHGDKEGGGNAKEDADEGPADLLVVAQGEAGDDDSAAGDGGKRGGLAEDDKVKDYVENDGERAGDLVERDLDVLEAQVVEDDHAGEDKGQRQHLLEDVRADLEGRDVRHTQRPRDVAEQHGDHALRPCDEERRRDLVGGAQQRLVGEHHRNGDDPVERHGQEDVAHLARQRDRGILRVCRHGEWGGLCGGGRGRCGAAALGCGRWRRVRAAAGFGGVERGEAELNKGATWWGRRPREE